MPPMLIRSRWLLAVGAALAAGCSAPAHHRQTQQQHGELGDTHVTAPPRPDAQEVTLVAQPGSDGDADLAQLANRWVALYDELATACATPPKDCAAATATVARVQARFADVGPATAKIVAGGGGPALHDALAEVEARIGVAAEAVASSPAVAKCGTDTGFMTAFNQLVGGRP